MKRAAKPYKQALAEWQRKYFEALIARAEGSMARAAMLAGLNRTAFYMTLKRAGLDSYFRRVGGNAKWRALA